MKAENYLEMYGHSITDCSGILIKAACKFMYKRHVIMVSTLDSDTQKNTGEVFFWFITATGVDCNPQQATSVEEAIQRIDRFTERVESDTVLGLPALASAVIYEHNNVLLKTMTEGVVSSTTKIFKDVAIHFPDGYLVFHEDGSIDDLFEGEVKNVVGVHWITNDGYSVGEECFPKVMKKQAIKCFIQRMASDNPSESLNSAPNRRGLVVMTNNTLFSSSHYHYLDDVIELFWKKAVGKTLNECWASGIVASHGDKCYGYRSMWKEAGIRFEHGALLFLLSYQRSIFGDRERHTVGEWVIEVYPKYKEMIEQTEREILETVYMPLVDA